VTAGAELQQGLTDFRITPGSWWWSPTPGRSASGDLEVIDRPHAGAGLLAVATMRHMTTVAPLVVDEILALDDDALALWLLGKLDVAPPNEKGEGFISERLAEWFPSERAIGAFQQVSATGIPLPRRSDEVERRLLDAYSVLMTRGWIRPDGKSGSTFCEITGQGKRSLAVVPGHDHARVAFAAKALTFELHPALQARHVDAHFRQGRFETALRDSSAFLEDAIKTLSGITKIGVQLVEEAFATGGPLADPKEHSGQATGLQRLFMGFFGAVRNRLAHTQFRFSEPKEAFQLLMLVDYLTGKLDEAYQRHGQTLT
jgi:uncharacterized protein (TIGR02391 family)